MLLLAPPSRATTCRPSPRSTRPCRQSPWSSVQLYSSAGRTACTQSAPAIPAAPRALATSAASSNSSVESTPRIAPPMRSFRTSARVSMPWMPITLFWARYSSSDRSAR